MTDYNCKAITEAGEQCRLKAGTSGYCHVQDPTKVAARKATQEAIENERHASWKKGEKLREVLEVIETTYHAAG